jgi:hypothetical protein
MTKKELIKLLLGRYPKMHIMVDGNGWVSESDDSFAISTEHDVMASNGYDLFNYWTENYTDFEFGVHNELISLLEDNGWYPEWVNPGVLGIHKNI